MRTNLQHRSPGRENVSLLLPGLGAAVCARSKTSWTQRPVGIYADVMKPSKMTGNGIVPATLYGTNTRAVGCHSPLGSGERGMPAQPLCSTTFTGAKHVWLGMKPTAINLGEVPFLPPFNL